MKKQFKVVGKTTDNKLVVTEVYKLYETHGIPLDIIFEFLNNHNMIPDWNMFCIEATNAGIKIERVLGMLADPISDTYGPEYREYILNKLKKER